MRTAAIGVFDSGIGGLTVARELSDRLPHEHVIYLGDTARLPYGSKSAETVSGYARKCVRFLTSQGVKAIVVACNTASALALPTLGQEFEVPVLGVIGPGARAAVQQTRGGPVGVIGQEGTVRSGSYELAIHARRPWLPVVSQPCPLLVPLAEEGWVDTEVARLVLERYLEPLAAARVDTLVLGCTHYPLFKPLIRHVLKNQYDTDAVLVDSAEAVTDDVARMLTERDLLNPATVQGERRFFCTDAPERFQRVGRAFFGSLITDVTQVDL